MPTQNSENGGMTCGSIVGYRLCVRPSTIRDSSKCSMALRTRRSSPPT